MNLRGLSVTLNSQSLTLSYTFSQFKRCWWHAQNVEKRPDIDLYKTDLQVFIFVHEIFWNYPLCVPQHPPLADPLTSCWILRVLASREKS